MYENHDFSMILMMTLGLFLFSGEKIFCDDGGNTNNSDSKNPKTAVVFNEIHLHKRVTF